MKAGWTRMNTDFWVGTPRCGVRSAQRADPAISISPVLVRQHLRRENVPQMISLLLPAGGDLSRLGFEAFGK